jgi:hypothetical protein
MPPPWRNQVSVSPGTMTADDEVVRRHASRRADHALSAQSGHFNHAASRSTVTANRNHRPGNTRSWVRFPGWYRDSFSVSE